MSGEDNINSEISTALEPAVQGEMEEREEDTLEDRAVVDGAAAEVHSEESGETGAEQTKELVGEPVTEHVKEQGIDLVVDTVIERPVQMKSFSFSFNPHILDHLAYSRDRNPAHLDPIHVKQVLLSLEAQPMLHADKLRFNELRERYAAQGVNKKRKDLLDEAVRIKIREFGPSILALDHPLIFPGAESVAYSERFIPADEFVAKMKVNFMNPLLVDQFGTSVVGASRACTEYPGRGMKEYKIVATGDLLGETVPILDMEVVTFSKDAVEEEAKFVQEEFAKFAVEKVKEGWTFNDVPIRDLYHEKLLVTEQALTDYLRSIDQNGSSQRPKHISPFAIAALLPRLLITLADKYRREHQELQTPRDNEAEKRRFALINEYVSKEEKQGVLTASFDERVNEMMDATFRIYNSQSGIFSRSMSLSPNENFNLAVFLIRYNSKKGKFEFVTEAKQGWQFPLIGTKKRVFIGAGDALEQPLYNEVMMEYVLGKIDEDVNINLRTMKLFCAKQN